MNKPLSQSYVDAPLLNLLGKGMMEMSEEELRNHIQHLREVSSSSTSLKKLISDKPPAKEKKEAVDKALINKYLNL